jgi:hypothetical protein
LKGKAGAGKVVPVIECLISNNEALSLNATTTKKKKKSLEVNAESTLQEMEVEWALSKLAQKRHL